MMIMTRVMFIAFLGNAYVKLVDLSMVLGVYMLVNHVLCIYWITFLMKILFSFSYT